MLNNTVHCEDVFGNFSIYLNCVHIYLPPNQYIHKPEATKRTPQDPIFFFLALQRQKREEGILFLHLRETGKYTDTLIQPGIGEGLGGGC